MKAKQYTKASCKVSAISHPTPLCQSNTNMDLDAGEMYNGVNDENDDFFND